MKRFLAILIGILLSSACVQAGGMEVVTSNDINRHWAQNHIERLLARNMGPDIVEKGTFNPDEILTRGEFAVMICRVLRNMVSGKENYTEEYNAVKAYREQAPAGFEDYGYYDYFGYVERAAKRGIIKPDDGEFKPNIAVTRGDFIKSVIILLEKVNDPFLKISNIAEEAYNLNKHLTVYKDASVKLTDYPGWIRVAQKYKLLADKKDYPFIGIDYQAVFYNRASSTFQFNQDAPVTRALAAAVFSALFCKWDVYNEAVPYDVTIGNESNDLRYRQVNDESMVNARLISIHPEDRTIVVEGDARKTKRIDDSIYKTLYNKEQRTYKIDEGGCIHVYQSESSNPLVLKGPDAVEKLNEYIEKLKTFQLESFGVSCMLVPKEYCHSLVKEDVAGNMSNPKKVQVAGLVHIILNRYDYHGRVIALQDGKIEMVDFAKGHVVLLTNEKTIVEKIIVSKKSMTAKVPSDSYLDPDNKSIYQMPVDAVKPGEEVFIKADREMDKIAVKITSYLLRIGIPSNIEPDQQKIRTEDIVDLHYKYSSRQWDAVHGIGLKTWYFSGTYWNGTYWKDGDIDLLFKTGTKLREVDLYVQPAISGTYTENQAALEKEKIFFVEAIQK